MVGMKLNLISGSRRT